MEEKKTLILNGSPRKNGDTAYLIRMLTEHLDGEVRVLRCYETEIRPCIDCRYCRTHEGCVIQDEMQEWYHFIEDCDRIVVASPVYFSTLTGKLLDAASRLQCYFSAEFFQKKQLIAKEKDGAVILTGGGSGGAENALQTAHILLREMNCTRIAESVLSLHTDRIPAEKDPAAAKEVRRLAEWMRRA